MKSEMQKYAGMYIIKRELAKFQAYMKTNKNTNQTQKSKQKEMQK